MTRSAQVRSLAPAAPIPATSPAAAAVPYDTSGVADPNWTTFVNAVKWKRVDHVTDIWVKLFDCPRCGDAAQLSRQPA